MDITSQIPTNNGNMFNIYFDNGGTTPPIQTVVKAIEDYTPWYKYVASKSLKADFFLHFINRGGRLSNDMVIYTKNSTEAINILSNVVLMRYQDQDSVVITTYMEHLSKYLPWKFRFETVLVDVLPDGQLSMRDLKNKLWRYRGRAKLVAVTGASNVTGYVTQIHKIARMAHRYGAEIFVDGAQLVQHRSVCMKPSDPAERIDYLSFSAHKIYAPAFSGALIGPQCAFDRVLPLYFGAGMESFATDQQIELKQGPERYEGGSNNLLGAIAISCALETIRRVGMYAFRKQESDLLEYGINLLSRNPNIILYGDTKYLEDRIPIISFNVRGKNYEASMAFFNQRFELDRLAETLEQYR